MDQWTNTGHLAAVGAAVSRSPDRGESKLGGIHQPRQLLDRPARREAILRGAAEAFADKGYAATSMEDVAAAAGITKLIVYRHFDSKQTLYDAVLERVSERLREEFSGALQPGRLASGSVAAMLAVAREDPSGFSLLWRHAAREPQFAEHADQIRSRVVAGAEALLTSIAVGEGRVRRWAAATLVSYLVAGVLHWLEEGDPDDDGAFAELMGRSLPALVLAWKGPT